MQSASFICSSNPLHPNPISTTTSFVFSVPFRARPSCMLPASNTVRLLLNPLQNRHLPLLPLHITATQEHAETAQTELGFVEVGYISNVHGLQGETRVKSSTEFPELRFSKPGRRWLKQQVSGRETIQEVELVEGKGHPGQKSWILKFRGIDTVDQAKQLIGSTLLAREEERPDLEEGEFYTRDLVGMRVLLKETGEPVGTVVKVYSTGASDLLQVILDSSSGNLNLSGGKKSSGTRASGHLVWVPFVEAIVPDVDESKREMHITPPKGLLELNLRSDEKSKKERRQLEWKDRKKFQRRLIAAKKKLCEMEQKHVFHGLRFGEREQRSLLADEIIGVNSKLFQQALQSIDVPSKRWNETEFVSAMKNKLIASKLSVSEETSESKENMAEYFHLQQKGLHLTSKGKVAIILLVDDSDRHGWLDDSNLFDSESAESSPCSQLETLVSDYQNSVKIEDRSVPMILCCSADKVQSLIGLFSNNDYFASAFDSGKVQFLEEEKLPVVSNSLEEDKRHKILMNSPWEMLQSPVGFGGVFSSLASHNILENLSENGVEYVEISSISSRHGEKSLLVGYVESCKADIGILVSEDTKGCEDNFNMIFSMNFIKKLTKQIDKLQFCAIPKQSSHVQLIDKEWVDVIPSSPNSFEFYCSIYSCLNACSLDKVCVLEITK